MLQVSNLSVYYGSFRALDDINIEAAEGELIVLLGANGAGKTSIFMTVSGLNRAASGAIQFGERNLVGMKPSQIVAAGVVHCPEGRKLFPAMSVLKNLMLGAYVHRSDPGRKERSADRFPQRRPAADGRDRPRAARAAESASSGRTLAGSGSASGEADVRDHRND
jgi:branched-chain amino acid transport system ATP-binding protein